MRVNLYLFKKDISPKNLPIFTSPEDRETYFSESNADKVYKNISYNGTRNIRLNANAFEANLDYYNYARINWTDKEDVEHNYYCFIDIVKYVNDNVSELQLTLDYVTTYYFDIKLNEFNLVQLTTKNDMKNRRLLNGNTFERFNFENKYPCKYTKSIENIAVLPTPQFTKRKYILKWLLINASIIDSDNESLIYENNGTRVICIPFPVVMDISIFGNERQYIKDCPLKIVDNDTVYTVTLDDIFSKYAGRILNISMIDNYFDVPIKEDSFATSSDVNDDIIITGKEVFISHIIFNRAEVQGKEIPFLTAPIFNNSSNMKAIRFIVDNRGFYQFYKIVKNGNEEVVNTDIEDIDYLKNTSEVENDIGFTLALSVDPIFPNNIKIEFGKRDNDNIMFNEILRYIITPPAISGIQFDVSKWSEYFIQNSASVNDGLATKHKYDLENADLQRTSSHIQGALNFAGSGASAMTGLLGGVIMENEGGFSKGAGQAITAVTSYASNITATEYAYQIAENNIQKEKAMLEISWNDIKNSPNVMYNYGSGNNILSYIETAYQLCYYKPTDQTKEDVRNYHMQYGYKINKKYCNKSGNEGMKLNDIMLLYEDVNNTINDINYKFLRFESDFVIDNLPLTVRKMLSEIFKDGVKFYNKTNMNIVVGENFNNYIPEF